MNYKKVVLILSILVFANVSMAQWLWWTNDGGNQLWTDSANWTADPTSGDDVVIGTDYTTGPVLNTGDTGYGNWIHLTEASTLGSLLTINGGTLQCSDHLLVGENWGSDHKGTLLVNSGTVNTTLLMVGGGTDGSNGNGTVTINDGVINISWLLAIGGGYNGTTGGGVGHVQLDGGTISALGGGGLVMSNNGSLDITDGALVLAGEVTDITSYGNVTAFSGTGSFVYAFDGSNTTVTAIPEPATLVLLGLGVIALRKKRS